MLRIHVSKSASAAKKYYTEKYYSEGKSREHYYSEKDQAIGTWHGKAAERLGLKGEIKKEDFASLCDNQMPGTLERLTERKNIESRVGYDLTFNTNKSVGLAFSFASEQEKKEIIFALRESVREVMSEVEAAAQARVRIKGANDNRETGNIAYSEHIHYTSRPIDGVPDPHLHVHCFVFNATYDDVENKRKAIEFGQIKKDAPYYETLFHSIFANKLQKLGYEVEKALLGFELKGIQRETIDKFSRRTMEIEQLAEEKNITDIETKAGLGARTRESKRESISEAEQYKNWDSRLTQEERLALKNLKNGSSESSNQKEADTIAKEAVAYSVQHNLERKSVASDKEILTTAIKSTIGETTASKIKLNFAKDKSLIIVKEKNQVAVTTKDALAEENTIIAKAHATKGAFKPINENYQPKTPQLNDEQKEAIKHALTTSDGISIIVGKAGTGKTTLMKEVQSGIKESGREIFSFAPSAEASRGVQREEGFDNATTIAALVQSKKLQEQTKNQVIWIDEAGMVSNKDMNKLLDISKEQNARLVFTGDTKQHSSVGRGDPLRTLQKEAGIAPIQVTKIQRQKDRSYKEAVSHLSKGDTEKGFNKLDRMGALHEIGDASERVKAVASDYIKSAYGKSGKGKPKEVLVVSPTHAEGNKVTEEIRKGLKERNLISPGDRKYITLKNTQLTEAQKLRPENYEKGNWVVFRQNVKGFKAGGKYEVMAKGEKKSIIVKDSQGKQQTLVLDKPDRFNLYKARETSIAKGDRIRITDNGKATDGKHLFNGTVFQVDGFDIKGNIKLSNGSTITKDFNHFTLGYVVTSHASQGKTVDKVILSQSSMSFKASSKEQFYVSVSRGKQAVAIYTDSKADLLHSVSRSGERRSAIELTKGNQELSNIVDIGRRRLLHTIRDKTLEAIKKAINKNEPKHGLQRHPIAKETGRSR